MRTLQNALSRQGTIKAIKFMTLCPVSSKPEKVPFYTKRWTSCFRMYHNFPLNRDFHPSFPPSFHCLPMNCRWDIYFLHHCPSRPSLAFPFHLCLLGHKILEGRWGNKEFWRLEEWFLSGQQNIKKLLYLKKNRYMYICNWITAIHLKLTQHCVSTIFQDKIKMRKRGYCSYLSKKE